MRKYIIGTIFGFMLAITVSANAQGVSKLIDSVVQGTFPVTIQGNSLGDAIVVNDTTYLPVREFGEATGYTVTFTDSREVVLTKKQTVAHPAPSAQPTKTVAEQISDLTTKIADLKAINTDSKGAFDANEGLAKRFNVDKDALDTMQNGIMESITRNEKLIAEYEGKIKELQSQQ